MAQGRPTEFGFQFRAIRVQVGEHADAREILAATPLQEM
jgi:hypothetical protein